MEYRTALYELSEELSYIYICDPLKVKLDLFYGINKNYLSFSSENLIHPNDYGMRIIAQCVIAALTK